MFVHGDENLNVGTSFGKHIGTCLIIENLNVHMHGNLKDSTKTSQVAHTITLLVSSNALKENVSCIFIIHDTDGLPNEHVIPHEPILYAFSPAQCA